MLRSAVKVQKAAIVADNCEVSVPLGVRESLGCILVFAGLFYQPRAIIFGVENKSANRVQAASQVSPPSTHITEN